MKHTRITWTVQGIYNSNETTFNLYTPGGSTQIVDEGTVLLKLWAIRPLLLQIREDYSLFYKQLGSDPAFKLLVFQRFSEVIVA